MATYTKATASMLDILAHLLDGHHKKLAAVGVRVFVLAAYGKVNKEGETVGDAITVSKRRAWGTCKILNAKDRMSYEYDVRVELDGDRWDGSFEEDEVERTLTTNEKLAILHHELMHVEVVVDDRGPVKDDNGLIKLTDRPHDIETGWFEATARLFGNSSQEVQQAHGIERATGQLFFAGLGFRSTEAAANDAHVTH